MLIGNQATVEDDSNPYTDDTRENRHKLKENYREGPLYRFLETIIDKKERQSDLHVIHLRDWHELSPEYDEERRLYGGHCEANTWEAMPIDGYETFLQPWAIDDKSLRLWATGNKKMNSENHPRSLGGWQDSKKERKKVRFYEILSDSVFDFRYAKSIDYLPDIDEKCAGAKAQSHLSVLLNHILETAKKEEAHVYVTVIGVYTDIKVRTLLTGLRSRYNEIDSLIVSDTLTAAPSIDRHLGALDFIDKVLNVEVISNLNTIVSIMDKDILKDGKSTEEDPIPAVLTESSLRWRDYRHYHLDKQIVLAYQDKSLAQYLKLTTERSNRLYKQIESINIWLMWFGRVALFSLALFIIMSVMGYDIPLEALIFTGLVSTTQIIPVFIDTPQKRIQENLATLVRLRNYLESYSMVSALLRHHLTSPRQLSGDTNEQDEALLLKRNERIREHMQIIQQGAEALRDNFGDIHPEIPDVLNPNDNNTP